ncbi:MAG: SH3 domain-containing protein, partial [Chloroflexota bacterium]
LPPRLNAGGLARIGVNGTANRLRELPNVNARQIGLIQPGSTITVLDGPSCEETSHIIWWRVDDNGTVGWTAEGVLPGDYFLAPLGSSLPSERSLITSANADTLVPLSTISLAGVNSVAFSPDGTLIALGGRSGLSVYNMATLSFLTTLSDISTPVAEIAFSPDGRVLAYTTLDGRLLLRDTLNGAATQLVNASNDRHASLSFNPAQGALLASGSGVPVSAVLRPSAWRFYDLSTQQEVLTQTTDDWVRAVAFSLDGTLFAWMDNAVHIIEVDGSVSVATLALEEIPFRGLAWRPAPIGVEPAQALAFPDGAMVRLVDLDASTEQTYLGDDGFIPQAIGFNADGTLLAAMDTPVSDTSGSTVNLFDVDTGDLIASTLLQASQAISFSPDSTLLVVASLDEVVFLGVSAEEVEAVG